MHELSTICTRIMARNVPPQAFRNFAARAVNAGWTSALDGRGVDRDACFLHDRGVEEWARRIVLLLPSLRAYHGEARAWLERHQMKDERGAYEGRIPFNIFLGGVPV